MSDEIKDGGPAFPSENQFFGTGMSLRDWFAGKVLQAVMSDQIYREAAQKAFPGKMVETISSAAYECADAMLAEREKGNP
jgi:hypothetical protein